MKQIPHLALIVVSLALFAASCRPHCMTSGNPAFPGWYSDPEGVIWEDEYWIFPTASLPFEEQVYMDAFSSKDLVNWTKHERIVDTTEVKWIWQAMWSPAVIEKDGYYYLFICGNDMYADGDGGIGYVRADKPGGPYKDILRSIYIQRFRRNILYVLWRVEPLQRMYSE